MIYFAIFVILMKKKDISSIFKNNVDKFDSKFTNWIIKKETNKNEDRNLLLGLSLLSRRGRETKSMKFFWGHPFETEVGSWKSWNSRCWSGCLVKVETQAGRIWKRERWKVSEIWFQNEREEEAGYWNIHG